MTESLQRQSDCRKVAADERGVDPAIYGPGGAHSDGKSSQLAHDQNCSGDVFGVDLFGCFETGQNGANGMSDMAGKAARQPSSAAGAAEIQKPRHYSISAYQSSCGCEKTRENQDCSNFASKRSL